jgi:hypothetical protein
MALWQVDIEKLLEGEYWTNRYIVSALNLADAASLGDDIVELEKNIHRTNVQFTKVRTSDFDPGTDVYRVRAINEFGELAAVSGDMLPLWNVCRVDFSTGSGRPSRKYLRLPCYEGDIVDGVFNSGFLATIGTSYAVPLLALTGFVDVDNQVFTEATVNPRMAMRQLRRGSRRRAAPILP